MTGTVPLVPGHLFISYSHHDHGYVSRLVAHLRDAGIEVWTDEGIDYGTQWASTIETQIETCAAFIPVMSGNSRSAAWVAREIDLAQELRKPIYPVLLSGRQFLRLRDIQHEDVSNSAMPSDRFIQQIRSTLSNAGRPSDDEIAALSHRHHIAVDLANGGQYAQAAQLLRDVVAERTRVLGPDH